MAYRSCERKFQEQISSDVKSHLKQVAITWAAERGERIPPTPPRKPSPVPLSGHIKMLTMSDDEDDDVQDD
eukprot:6491631-Karenia_brevis.AAC.1